MEDDEYSHDEYEINSDDEQNIIDINYYYELEDNLELYYRNIWNTVFVPYINCTKSKLLDKLNENDFHKFYEFMVKNFNFLPPGIRFAQFPTVI